jgi:hypothetical protein
MRVVHTILSVDGSKKVEFIRHDDGTFGFVNLKLGEEECWYPCGRYSECHASTLDLAMREAAGRVEWLSNQLSPQAGLTSTDS